MTATIENNLVVEQGWAALPPSYRIPEKSPSLEEAQEYCRQLAESHYENFHVATWFLPASVRPHLYPIYAYCRISDDLGDEVGNPAQSLALLDLWQGELDACYEGRARHPVFVALRKTIRICAIPKKPFADLLIAFRQDQRVTRYANREELLGYCENSANPVGRLVLYAFGCPDESYFSLSDATCTALQLANFWQDVARDYAKGRVYLPQDALRKFGVSESTIADGKATPEFRALLRSEVDCARSLFQAGLPLVRRVPRELAVDLELFSRGGLAILREIERRNYDVLSTRPKISGPAKAALLLRALVTKWLPSRPREAALAP